MSKQRNEMREFVKIVEGLSTPKIRVEFTKPVAVKAVNMINVKMKEYDQPNRAFLVDPSTIEMDVPAGIEVDITDHIMDELGGGMYGSVWGDVAEEGLELPAEKTCACEGICECGATPMKVEGTILGSGMNPEARERDIEQSDREYIAQRQKKEAEKARKDAEAADKPATNEESDFMHDIQLESIVADVLGEAPNLKRLADQYVDDEGHYDVDAMSDEIGDDEVVPAKKELKKKKTDDEDLDGLRFG